MSNKPSRLWGSSRVSKAKEQGKQGEALEGTSGTGRGFGAFSSLGRRNTTNNGRNQSKASTEDNWRLHNADLTGPRVTGVTNVGDASHTEDALARARSGKKKTDSDSQITPATKESSTKKFMRKLGLGPKDGPPPKMGELDGSPEFAEAISDAEMAASRAGSIAAPAAPADPESPPPSPRLAEFVDTYTPNSLGESNDADDEEVVKSWFTPPSSSREPVLNPPCNDIHLYPGVATQLVDSEGAVTVGGWKAEFTRRTLQRVDDTEDPFMDNNIGVWTERRRVDHRIFRPGDIIRAIHSVAQNDIRQPYPSSEVRIFGHGPVFSKVRPMVVLFKTADALLCLPMFTCQFLVVGGIEPARVKEYMSIHTQNSGNGDRWKGHTPANGKPLSMVISPGVTMKEESFVSLARPVNISRCEAVKYRQARLTPESYVRLVEAFVFRQNERIAYAYKELKLHYPGGIMPPKDTNQEWPSDAIAVAKSRLVQKVKLNAADVKDSFKVNR